jgi:hypothetical protein
MKAKKAALVLIAIVVNLLIVCAVAFAKQPPPPPPPPRDPCKGVLCANPDCLPGEHTEIPPGGCCPVCVPD